MIMVRASKNSEAGVLPDRERFYAMAAFNEELVKAGVLVDAAGLMPTTRGARIHYHGDQRTVIEGAFPDPGMAGFWIIDVKSRHEAVDWAMRIPKPHPEEEECWLELRRMFEVSDFDEHSGEP